VCYTIYIMQANATQNFENPTKGAKTLLIFGAVSFGYGVVFVITTFAYLLAILLIFGNSFSSSNALLNVIITITLILYAVLLYATPIPILMGIAGIIYGIFQLKKERSKTVAWGFALSIIATICWSVWAGIMIHALRITF